jgi:hypothetical protein
MGRSSSFPPIKVPRINSPQQFLIGLGRGLGWRILPPLANSVEVLTQEVPRLAVRGSGLFLWGKRTIGLHRVRLPRWDVAYGVLIRIGIALDFGDVELAAKIHLWQKRIAFG